MTAALARRALAGLAFTAFLAAGVALTDAIVERSPSALPAQPPELAVRALVWERTHCREC